MLKFSYGVFFGIVLCLTSIYFNDWSREDTPTKMRREHQESMILVVGLNPEDELVKGVPHGFRTFLMNNEYTITFVDRAGYEDFTNKLHKLVKDK